MEHDIGFWFLLFGLFFPRLTLFISWCMGVIPHNTVPFLGEVIGSIFMPRILFMMYIVSIQGFSIWFFVYFAVAIVSYLKLFLHRNKK
jgi:hypothetical protein